MERRGWAPLGMVGVFNPHFLLTFSKEICQPAIFLFLATLRRQPGPRTPTEVPLDPETCGKMKPPATPSSLVKTTEIASADENYSAPKQKVFHAPKRRCSKWGGCSAIELFPTWQQAVSPM